MADVVAQTNAQIAGAFTGINVLTILGWFLFAVICIGAGAWGYVYWKNKKLFNKSVEINEAISGEWVRTAIDKAKTVKLGSGGFAIFYLKKQKTWKIAYGGRIGKRTYAFYIMPDGYWYNGIPSANVFYIDQNKGMIPVITTNPSMRSQYTSLEKQIDALHLLKKGFWEQYGSWVMSIAFVMIAGVFLWLNYREFVAVSTNLNAAIDKIGIVFDKFAASSCGAGVPTYGGEIPIK